MGNCGQHFEHALNFPQQLAANTSYYKTHNIKRILGYGLKTTPFDSQKPLKHEHNSTVDTSADKTSDYLTLSCAK